MTILRLIGNLVILAVALVLFVLIWPFCAVMDWLD